VPPAIEAVFATLAEQDAFLARLTWATMRDVPRDHLLIAAMIAAGVATAAQVDALFALGASIP
jgi:preprotein translocase subunit SecE